MNKYNFTKILAFSVLCAASFSLVVPHAASALTERQCKSQSSIYKRTLSYERRAISKFDRETRKLESLVRRYDRDVERQERDNYKCQEKIDNTIYRNQVKLDSYERRRQDYIAKAAGLAAQALQCGFGFFSSRSCNADRYQAQANRLLQQAVKIEQQIPQIRHQNDTKLANEQAKCQRKAAEGITRTARSQGRVDGQLPAVNAAASARDAAVAARVAAEAEYNQCLATPPPPQ